jgi:hypothetical protein
VRGLARPHGHWSADSRWSVASWRSIGSVGSALSIGSTGSVLSIGSAGSILSIGSTGSILSIGSAGAIGAIGGSPPGVLRGDTLSSLRARHDRASLHLLIPSSQ